MRVRDMDGGRIVEIEPDRLIGWLNRFADRQQGLTALTGDSTEVLVRTVSGASALIRAPFPDLPASGVGTREHQPCTSEPLADLLDRVAGLGRIGIIAIRGGAHSIGVARGTVIDSSHTGRHYLQGRTAAGGWSQQRFARRRGNQRAQAATATAAAARRVLGAVPLDALVLAGDRTSYRAVLGLLPEVFGQLPRREFPDITQVRRAILDELARRARYIEVTITDPR